MPADYTSTARALALPVSPPPRSPAQQYRPQVPWTRRSQHSPTRPSAAARQGVGLRDRTINYVEGIWRRLNKTVEKMTPVQMAVTAAVGVASVVLAILFLVFSTRIFEAMEPIAEKWKNLKGGWLILWIMTFATAFPPVIGYSTCLTLAGFVYGFPLGWPIVATATVVGSTCSFIVSRTVLAKFVERLVSKDRRFEALSLVLKRDGLKLLIMIRLCPLPYSISNGAISTFPTVQPLMFALATAAATPKLFIAVFIGSRLAEIGKTKEKMDARTKAINWASIIFGSVLGITTGWLIYKRTLARSRQLEAEERAAARNSNPQDGDYDNFVDNPSDHDSATLIRDDQIDFLDNGQEHNRYQDDISEDGNDNDVFKFGDGDDEEEVIGLNKQPPKR